MRFREQLLAGLSLSMAACAISPETAPPPRAVQSRFAFLAHRDGFWQVWVANADGSGARQVTRSQVEKVRISWFPDARAILVDTQDGRLARVDAETGVETPVVLPVHGMLDAVVSPDGRRVAFSLTQSDSPDANELWLCDPDGGNLRELTNRAGLQYQPAWDPRGDKLYYLSSLGPAGSHDIWRIAPDGSADERLTFGELRHLDVAVSSRGDIAYSGNQERGFDIWLKSPGAKPVRLTDDGALDANPSFSPDGDSILFESSRGGALNVWRVSRSGGSAEQVTRFDPPGARLPVWAPDPGTR